jgi:histidinol phosphatase-like enzyme (inositol monophosphatase family)
MEPVNPADVDYAVDIVRRAGELTLGWFQSPDLDVDAKGDGTPVTVADRAAERFMREQIAERWPDDAVIGEEEADQSGTSGRTWIIDPIDGTKAFTHGVPLYTNLLALNDAHGPAIGVINVPAIGVTVWAGRGLGCFENGQPAHVNDRSQLDGGYVSTSGLGTWSDRDLLAVRATGAQMRTWGDGYGYALVATGRIEAMVDPVAAIWDVAPMPVILTEAGGRFTDLRGDNRVDGGCGIASNGLVHDDLLAAFGR